MPRYRAFLSYSHTDEQWASWLHRELEGYRIPRKLVGRDSPLGPIPRKLFPVFRDREELPTAQALSSEIERALGNSDSLIVICSPAAVRSTWVNEEIRRYKAQGHADRVFCLIVDGEPGDSERECFPEAIRYQVDAAGQIGDQPAEPIAADLRPGKDGKADAKLKLIAGLLGIGLNELKQRELAARNRRLTAISSVAVGVAVVTVGLAVLATQARNEAQAQRRIAETRQQQAEGLIQFMLGDLREKLEPIGKLDVLGAVGEQAMAYFGRVDPASLSDTELAARATALRQIGDISLRRGQLKPAAAAFQEALALDSAAIARRPDDEQAWFNVSQSEFYVGYHHYVAGELDRAMPWFERYVHSANELLALNPTKLAWRQEAVSAATNIGVMHIQQSNWMAAEKALKEAERRQLNIADSSGDPREALAILGDIRSWHAEALIATGQIEQAIHLQLGHVRLLRELQARYVDDANLHYRLVTALQQYTQTVFEESLGSPERAVLDEVVDRSGQLIRLDPSNQEWRDAASVARIDRAKASIGQRGARASAAEDLTQALNLTRADARQQPPVSRLIRQYFRALNLLLEFHLLQGNAPLARAVLLREAFAAGPCWLQQNDAAEFVHLALLAEELGVQAKVMAQCAPPALNELTVESESPFLTLRLALRSNDSASGDWGLQRLPIFQSHLICRLLRDDSQDVCPTQES